MWHINLASHCQACFHLLHEAWIQVPDYGIKLSESTCITHLSWSDNVFLFARTPKALQAMLQSLTTMMASKNLRWEDSEMFFLIGARDDGLSASLVQNSYPLNLFEYTHTACIDANYFPPQKQDSNHPAFYCSVPLGTQHKGG